jgi:hypothetical protein
VWQAKDFKSNEFGCVARKGLMGAIFGCVANTGLKRRRAGVGRKDRAAAPTSQFFVSADSKAVAGDMSISVHSARVKVAEFSVSWKRLVSADSKEVTSPLCLLKGKQAASADPKGLSDPDEVGAGR